MPADPGRWYICRNYPLSDGTSKPRLLLCVGSTEQVVIFLYCTKQHHDRPRDYGCMLNHRIPSFFVPAGTCCPRYDTWISLNTLGIEEWDAKKTDADVSCGELSLLCQVQGVLMTDILMCLAKSSDLTNAHRKAIFNVRSNLSPS